jgi:hypothetical protein
MTVKDALNAVRVMLGQDVATEEVQLEETPVVETVETELEHEDGHKEEKKSQLAEQTLVDGTVVYTEGELEVGATLFVQTDEEDAVFAPAGKHSTEDGLIITVGEGGVIEAIDQAEEEVEVVSEDAEDEKKEEEQFSKEELFEGIAEIIKPFTTEIEKLKTELSVLSERFEAVADSPAAAPVKKSFMEDAKAQKQVAAARFNRLSEIRRANK